MNKYTLNLGMSYLWLPPKLLLIVKLIIIIMTACFMQVSASTFAQKVTLSENNTPLEKVFSKIRKQTGYGFVYTNEVIKHVTPVNIEVKDVSLQEALSLILKNQPVEFDIHDNTVVIKEKSTFIDMKDKIFDVFQQEVVISLRLKDQKGNPLPGGSATIMGNDKSTGQTYRSNENGEVSFTIKKEEKVGILYIGYKTQTITVTPAGAKNGYKTMTVTMEQEVADLKEVAILGSNGYQDIDKTRSTGTYEVITAKQLEHSNDPNLLKRLDGITTSTVFNNQGISINSANSTIMNPISGTPANTNVSAATSSGQFYRSPLTNLTIRGKNTLTTNDFARNIFTGLPLVVIDGIASTISIDLVNPDDVENITILKDAASASIWGSRAANGVIVIKTKRGRYNSPMRISFNNSVSVTDKPNLFYVKRMSISDFIDAQIYGYSKQNPNGVNDPVITAMQSPLINSPVAEIMNDLKLKRIDQPTATARLDALRGNDIRNDFNKYLFRNAVAQNYTLNASGGSKNVNYVLSGGYNKNLENARGSGSDRWNLNANLSANPLKNLTVSAGLSYNLNHVNDQAINNRVTGVISAIFQPYSRLADDNGTPQELTVSPYRPVLINLLESTYKNNLLSARYKPLEDMDQAYQKMTQQAFNLNLNAGYRLTSWLNANLGYNYNSTVTDQVLFYSKDSYFMRQLINLYTNPTTFARPIPLGGGYAPSSRNLEGQTVRGQLTIDKVFGQKHELNAIMGVDIAQNKTSSQNDSYYGYNEAIPNRIVAQVDYVTKYVQLFNGLFGPATNAVPFVVNTPQITEFNNRTLGVFSNVGYTYDKRYTVTASLRRDGNSDFGIGSNTAGVPFYSLGAKWSINNEHFYNLDWLPSLSLRTNFGYNGNVNPSVLARQVIFIRPSLNDLGFTTAIINANGLTTGIDNRDLRPEKNGQLELGLDFGLKGGRISGGIAYYNKKITDLLASNIVDPSLGYTSAIFNTGNLRNTGFDISLGTVNIQSRNFRWTSNLGISSNQVKVTKLYLNNPKTVSLVLTSTPFYDVGYDLTRLFAYKWAGLDPSGNPRGYLNGQIVSITNDAAGLANYNAINAQPMSEAKYMGSVVPKYFGFFRNTFSYGRLDVTAGITYKMGYYFRRPYSTLASYSDLFATLVNPGSLLGAEFNQRWQKPGDELTTNVPSLVYGTNAFRDTFYKLSEINVLKGDNIRLQEVNLSYSFKSRQKWFIKNPRVYANIPLNVILWRANKASLDPDVADYPMPKTYGFGFSASF